MTEPTVAPDQSSTFSRRAFIGGALATAAAVGGAATLKSSPASAASIATALRSAATKSSTLTVGILADVVPASLLRIIGTNTPVTSLVFDTVLGGNLKNLRPQPNLATSWAWNASNTKLVVQLRDDVVYQTGRPFGPEDVIFSVEQTTNVTNGDQLGAIAHKITKMSRTGKNEVTFELAAPVSNFLNLLQITPVVDSKTFSGLASGSKVIGTGPFHWESWTPGTSLQLKRNPSYWQKGKPYLDAVTLSVIPNGSALADALQTGQIQLAWQMAAQQANTLVHQGSYKLITSAPQYTDAYIGVNTAAAPFNNPKVRQAVAYALDRNRMVTQAFAGRATATCVPFPLTLAGITSAESNYYSYDPRKAKQLFQEAGSPSTPISLIFSAGNAIQEAIVNIAQNDLESIGFRVSIQSLTSATYQAQNQAASFQGLWVGTIDGAGLDIATWLMALNPLKVGTNTSHVTNSYYATLANRLYAASTPQKLAAATSAVTKFVLQEAFHLTVAHGYYTSVAAKNLDGVAHSLDDYNLVLTSARLT